MLLDLNMPPRTTGNLDDPRVVWVMDGVGEAMISNSEDYGFDAVDQLAVFPEGRFGDVLKFFDERQNEFSAVRAFVFFLFGAGEISQDLRSLEELTSSPIQQFDDYFHPNGPRELPRHSAQEVVDKFHGVVDRILAQFPTCSVFTTEPSLRRSKHGFAAARAVEVGRRMKCRDGRHHHANVTRQLHSVVKSNADRLGGRYPINEEFFAANGVGLTPAALRSSFVRVASFVGVKMGLPGDWGDPGAIEGLKVAF